jgi:hypothetical protein
MDTKHDQDGEGMGGIGTSVTTYRLVIHDATRGIEDRDKNKKESRTEIRTKAQSTLLGPMPRLELTRARRDHREGRRSGKSEERAEGAPPGVCVS